MTNVPFPPLPSEQGECVEGLVSLLEETVRGLNRWYPGYLFSINEVSADAFREYNAKFSGSWESTLGVVGRAARWFFSSIADELLTTDLDRPTWLLGGPREGDYTKTLGGHLRLRLPGHKEMVEAFSMVLSRHKEASYVLTMLTTGRAVDLSEPTSLALYFEVGSALSELAHLDPLFLAAGPGIESYYSGRNEYPSNSAEMVGSVSRAIALALRDHAHGEASSEVVL